MAASVRTATVEDLPVLLPMLTAYLHEMRHKGSELQPTPRTINFFYDLCEHVIAQTLDGALVLSEDGFSLASDCTLPLDSDHGKTALGWGTWVRPEARGSALGDELRRALRTELRRKGFVTVLGGVYMDDKAALNSVMRTGWTPYIIHGRDDLSRGD